MSFVKIAFTPAESRCIEYKHAHCYNLQNDLLLQVNFPLYFYKSETQGDFASSFFEDRARRWDGFLDNVPGTLKKAWSDMNKNELLKLALEFVQTHVKSSQGSGLWTY